MSRRKHSKIDGLPGAVRETVEQMVMSNATYAEVADFIKSKGHEISIGSVWRYAKSLNATVKQLRMAQENFRIIMEEVAKYPNLDTTDGIIRLLSHNVLEAVMRTDKEDWEKVDPEKLLKQGSALIRAAAYKQNLDLKNQDILDAGFEQVKTLVFDALAKEQPDLYAQVAGFLNQKKAEGIDGGVA